MLPDKPMLRGKQYQGALSFCRLIMIETLPDRHKLRDYVSMATGYLGGGSQRENWELGMQWCKSHARA